MLDTLAGHLRDSFNLNPVFPLLSLLRRAGVQTITLPIRGMGKMTIRTSGSDARVLRQIFRDREYDVMRHRHGKDIIAFYLEMLKDGEVPIIIDAGANIGASAVWFAKAFPEAIIMSIEPEHQNAELCRHNTASLKSVRVVEAALGATSGHIEVINTTKKGESWAFRTVRSNEGKIPIVTIPELVASIVGGKLFAAKIDIEGFEREVFAENTAWIADLKFLFIEPHDWMFPGAGTSREFQRRIAPAGLDVIISGENLLYVANLRPQTGRPEITGE